MQFDKENLINELMSMPKALLIKLFNDNNVGEMIYKDGEAKCVDGTICSEQDLENFSRELISEHYSNIVLKNTVIFEVSDIKYNLDDDDIEELKSEFVFIVNEEDMNEISEEDYFESVISEKITNEAGFCFNECSLLIEKYSPF